MNLIKPVVAAILTATVAAVAQPPAIPVTEVARVSSNADQSVRAESVQRVQLKDGQLADWRTVTRVTRETQPGRVETTETVVQQALKGQPAQTAEKTCVREKTAEGEVSRVTELIRNPYGKIVERNVIDETSRREADGSLSVRIVEQRANVQGELAVQREEQRRVRPLSATDTAVESQIRSFDRLRGEFGVTAVQTTQIHTDNNVTRSDTVTRNTVGGQDRVVSRVLTTEIKAADGTQQRETIEYGMGLYDQMTPNLTEELQPRRKTVERVVKQPDGSTQLIRDVYRRDVNGDWQPVPFDWAISRP